MNAIVREFNQSQIIRKNVPFKIGDMVKVQIRIKEGEKERVQAFEGLVVGMEGTLAQMRFTVRKISYGIGVEKTFLYQSPLLKEVTLIRSGKVRRAKLYYLRSKSSKKDTRIVEKKSVKKAAAVPETGAAPSAEDLTPQLAPEEKPEPEKKAETTVASGSASATPDKAAPKA